MKRQFSTPAILQQTLACFTWRKPSTDKVLYLTFDDGPQPGVTDFVLTQLAEYNAKATFFCVGDNVRKYTALAKEVHAAGHQLGNHTYNHLNGWKTTAAQYVENTATCRAQLLLLNAVAIQGKPLFRPPYGKITPRQTLALKKDYELIMWSVLSYDFDQQLEPAYCLAQTIAATTPGDIIVFHDSLKAEKNLRVALPGFLQHFSALGYSFQKL